MSKVVRVVVGAVLTVAGVLTGNFALVLAGAQILTSSLFGPKAPRRAASAAQLQLGEQPRQAILGRAAVGGTLVDAFNYGGKYGTDWEVLVIALADHRCDALEGFFVDDRYVAFAGDGTVSGFNSQLQVFWRSGTWDQTVPSILTSNGPGWTANDRGRGVAYVVVAYKADKSDAKNPVWPSGRPRFRWVVRGLRCYDPRLDSTVGGSGAHRRDNPATWTWSENPIVIRHNWVRGIYAGDRVTEPGMLLVGRGLSAIEAPPANVFPRANLCDEVVGGTPRYRIGGVVASTEPFIDIESDFAAAVGGVISQPEGAVEVDPGQAKAAVAHFTDADLLVGSTVKWNERILGEQDDGWINTVAARFVDPSQRWNIRSAPVRRDLADVIADGGPRETQPQLDLVTNAPQAQRIAEIIRRLGRLWGRAEVTLPPRFAFIEEGDWVTWQSDRRFGGATLTFRVEAWGSDRAWHHRLVLRQISASVYSDTAPLDDGVIANDQPPPPVVAAPDPGAWNVAAVLLGSGSVRVPNLRVAGTPDDPAADFVVFEYVPQAAAPDAATIWTFAGSARPDVRLLDIPVIGGGTYWVGVSYVVDGIQGDRRVLGPISTAGLAYGDGSPVAPVAPANANRVPFSRMEGNRGWGTTFNPSGLAGTTGYGDFENRRFFVANVTATAAGQNYNMGGTIAFRVIAGERLSVQAKVDVFDPAAVGGSWLLRAVFFNAFSIATFVTVAGGTGPIGASTTTSGFIEVPAGQVSMILELVAFSGTSGSWQIAISEPMVSSAAPGQTVHPVFTPGPNASDGADPNNLITIDGAGIISGIGTANINVDNRRTNLSGLASARPASGAFINQTYHATDSNEISQWDGFNWRSSADVTLAVSGPSEVVLDYNSSGSIVTPLPTSTNYLLTPAGGVALTSGVSWSVAVASGTFAGAAPSMTGTGTGVLRINSALSSNDATLRITGTVAGRAYPPMTVRISRRTAAMPTSQTATSFANFNSSVFAAIMAPVSAVVPSGATSLNLTASGMVLTFIGVAPAGSTTVEMKWQRETSPGSGTWVDVGAAATSSPNINVIDEGGGVFTGSDGSITCNRTATGLTAGTLQNFRLVARVSAGNVRTVIPIGAAGVSP